MSDAFKILFEILKSWISYIIKIRRKKAVFREQFKDKTKCFSYHQIKKVPMINIFSISFFYYFIFFYYCSSTGFSISSHHSPPTPPIPTFYPGTYPLWLCPCVLYTHSLTALSLFPIFPHYPSLSSPLVTVCSLYLIFWSMLFQAIFLY